MKKFDHMFSCLDITPACDGQTDGRTDVHFSTAQFALCKASRGKALSDGMDVADIPKYLNNEQTRIPTSFIFHYSSGLALISAVGSCPYIIMSSVIHRTATKYVSNKLRQSLELQPKSHVSKPVSMEMTHFYRAILIQQICLSVCLSASVRPSVRDVPVLDENGLIYCHSFFTIRQPDHSSFISIKDLRELPTGTPKGGVKYRV